MDHTPGDWTFRHGNNLRIDGPDHKVVASILSTSRRPMEEKIANGHLLAASPKLLKACEFAIRGLNHHRACSSKKSGTSHCDCALGACRAAIAEATR